MPNLNELIECSGCKINQPLSMFWKREGRKSKRQSHCKDCQNAARRRQRVNNLTEFKARELKRGMRRHYGLTVEQREAMFKAQDGKCACCGRPESDFKRVLHVDHDHVTGKVRALLCTRCNPGLGYFQDSIELLEKGIEYLKKFKKLG